MKKILFIITLMQLTAFASPSCCTTNLPAATPLSDLSIYQLDCPWTSDEGKTVRLAELRGKAQVVTMFFASCAYVCPVLVSNVQEIEKQLRSGGVSDVEFLLVTFDTERDTVEKLHAYRQQRRLGNNWRLLRGKTDDVAELAALLGVKFKKEASGEYSHSNLITVLNPAGEIVHQQTGLGPDPMPSVAAVKKALEDFHKCD
jgi:protein SCO1/2